LSCYQKAHELSDRTLPAPELADIRDRLEHAIAQRPAPPDRLSFAGVSPKLRLETFFLAIGLAYLFFYCSSRSTSAARCCSCCGSGAPRQRRPGEVERRGRLDATGRGPRALRARSGKRPISPTLGNRADRSSAWRAWSTRCSKVVHAGLVHLEQVDEPGRGAAQHVGTIGRVVHQATRTPKALLRSEVVG